MGKQLVLALALVIALSAVAVISYAIADRPDAVTNTPETASLSGAEADGIAPVMDPVDLPVNPDPEFVSTDAGEADQAGGPNESIKVHGRWTLEVNEPDGRLVSLTEFDNALTATGAENLSAILAREITVGYWRVILSGSSIDQPCASSIGIPSSCQIWELPSSDPLVAAPNVFPDLTLSTPNSGLIIVPNSGALVLTGTATAANDAAITNVSAGPRGCSANTAPADASCGGGTLGFTSKDLNPGVDVLAGQTISVTVVVSFS